MDTILRNLERQLASENDFVIRHRLTAHRLRINEGTFVFWRGSFDDLKIAENSVLTQVSYTLSEKVECTETGYILVITDLQDLLGMLQYAPDYVMQLPSNRLTSLRNRSLTKRFKLLDLSDIGNINDFEAPSSWWDNVLRAFRLFRSPNPPHPRGRRLVEWFDQPLYDREIIKPGTHTGVVPFFITAVGEERSRLSYNNKIELETWVKMFADTNMDQAGSLPYPKQFHLTGFSIIPDASASMLEFRKIIDASVFRLHIGTHDYFKGPAALVAGLRNDGNPDFSLKLTTPAGPHYELNGGLDLIPQQNFRGELMIDKSVTITQPLGLRCILWGCFVREVY